MNGRVIYIVTMYKWGRRSEPSYVLGAWMHKKDAVREAEKEKKYRGDKFLPEIIEAQLNRYCHGKYYKCVEGYIENAGCNYE